MSLTRKRVVFWIAVFAAAFLLWQTLLASRGSGDRLELSLNEFWELVEVGEVERVTIRDRVVDGSRTGIDLTGFRVYLPYDPSPELIERLIAAGVEVHAVDTTASPLLAIFLTWGPVLVIIALWIYFMRMFRARGDGAGTPPAADPPASSGPT